MSGIRMSLLRGERPPGCEPCQAMEEHGKISGRQKQLLKTGVQVQDFAKTMRSSPWLPEWGYSQDHQGLSQMHVQDWQIDLGNFCNSACLFCTPESSSRIAAERVRLGMISSMPPRAWCDDPDLLDRFMQSLMQAPHLRYLHFIGGETLITPGFQKILQRLIDHGLHRDLIIGFTTNLTVMEHSVLDQLQQFPQVNLGMSIECMDSVNDYVRYGSEISRALQLLEHWLDIGRRYGWFIQLRTTPTILTVSRLAAVYDYAWNNDLVVESCNFIQDPEFMRPSVLPQPYRDRARNDLRAWISSKQTTHRGAKVINIRDPNRVHQQLLEDAQSYLHYLEHQPDLSHLLPQLVSYLKLMDQSRGNSVVDYLPEYEDLFRSVGY